MMILELSTQKLPRKLKFQGFVLDWLQYERWSFKDMQTPIYRFCEYRAKTNVKIINVYGQKIISDYLAGLI